MCLFEGKLYLGSSRLQNLWKATLEVIEKGCKSNAIISASFELADWLQLVSLQIPSFEHWPLFSHLVCLVNNSMKALQMAFKVACVTGWCCFSSSWYNRTAKITFCLAIVFRTYLSQILLVQGIRIHREIYSCKCTLHNVCKNMFTTNILLFYMRTL